MVDTWTVMDAPEPRQVLWPQLACTYNNLLSFVAKAPFSSIYQKPREFLNSQSHAILAASGRCIYFTAFNVFLGDTLGGTLFSAFKTIEKNPNQIVTVLATCLPGNATYFITFVALEKYLCQTGNESKEAWRPRDLEYETRVPGDMLILTVVLCYSVIAPIIIPLNVLYIIQSFSKTLLLKLLLMN
ncbi:hypothetical protein M0R45_030244 [Rubus argutus]|uniref:CSC1/OSCA1-like 7TM region domain-containing protein n=1 Tax=Rubus argutus TaxID=59490 RepID=A0AAW1WBA6_RUBAR